MVVSFQKKNVSMQLTCKSGVLRHQLHVPKPGCPLIKSERNNQKLLNINAVWPVTTAVPFVSFKALDFAFA